VKRSSGLFISFPRFFKAFLASALMALVISLPVFVWYTIPGLIVTIVAGAITYVGALYLLKGISKEDMIELMPGHKPA